MDNFDAHKWFKKQYLEEGMSDEEIHAIKRYEDLSADDKLKLAKIQKMMDKERELRDYYKGDSDVFPSSLKEDDLEDDRLYPDYDDIIEIIKKNSNKNDSDEMDEAMDVMEFIGQHYGINIEFTRF